MKAARGDRGRPLPATRCVPVEMPTARRARSSWTATSPIRPDTSIEALGKLNPAFRKEYGTVTAGNAPGLNDGASATVVASEAYARAHDLPILARITGYAAAAIEPKYIFACPPRAVRKLLDSTGMKIERLRRDRGQRGLLGAGARQRQRAGLGLEQGQPQRRRRRPGPSHRRERRACAGDAASTSCGGAAAGAASQTLCLGGGGAVALSIEV